MTLRGLAVHGECDRDHSDNCYSAGSAVGELDDGRSLELGDNHS